ncbi:MAG: hypothetical protein GF307_04975 [candidate division Zixibacteria bacterium]|nr:hypothetical protein [candidate division Zixibacteria bacterium]
MNRPRIGLSQRYVLRDTKARFPSVLSFEWNETGWAEGVYEAGGLPYYLPATENGDTIDELLDILDGVILVGGSDIDPSAYHQERIPECYKSVLIRDRFEIELINRVMKSGKPLLGACRGMQILNVALGGTLHQHIYNLPEKIIDHENTPLKDFTRLHPVEIEPESKLASILGGNKFEVNTSHHQAIDRLGDKLKACAWTEDSIIEGIELDGDEFVIGVQWHPESMLDSQVSKRIFRAFVEKCSRK